MVNDNNKFSQLCRPRHCGRGDKKKKYECRLLYNFKKGE